MAILMLTYKKICVVSVFFGLPLIEDNIKKYSNRYRLPVQKFIDDLSLDLLWYIVSPEE
jgi:hypothetical protein